MDGCRRQRGRVQAIVLLVLGLCSSLAVVCTAQLETDARPHHGHHAAQQRGYGGGQPPPHYPQQQQQQQQQHGYEQQQQQGPEAPGQQQYPGGDGGGSPQPGDGCPNAQPPTNVAQAYLGHGSFVWSELAHEAAAAAPAGRARLQRRSKEPPRRPAQRRPGDTRGQRPAAEAAAAVAAMDSGLAAAVAAMDGARPAAASDAPVATAGAAAAGSAGGSGGGTVATAAVTNAEFLLPVTKAPPSGKGFFGTYDRWTPDNALAVAPHPSDPDLNYVVHCVNSVCEIFFATKDGRRTPYNAPTLVPIYDMMLQASYNASEINTSDPTAWFDPAARRWVLVWTSFVNEPGAEGAPDWAPLYVAVSAGANPLGGWTVWVLESRPSIAPGLPFCRGVPGTWYLADYPQASYSSDGIFISIGGMCIDNESGEEREFLSALFAYSKASLFRAAPTDAKATPQIHAATYLAPGSWFFSVPLSERGLVGGRYKPFNNFIQPVSPQAGEDLERAPLFVMKVDNAFLSIATLTDEPLELMTSIETAPKLLATVVGKGADFANLPGQPEGEPVMHQPGTPQPNTTALLDAGDVGMVDSTYGVRSYHSVQHKGTLYTTALEYWGVEDLRLPSIYYGMFDVSKHLCRVRRHDWGLIASRDGLAVSYPVIGARADGSALVAYSYSGGSEQLPNNAGPAYAGVATSIVGGAGGAARPPSTIGIVKAGTVVIAQPVDPDYPDALVRFGDYSAAAFCDGGATMWFSALTANPLPQEDDWLPRYTWISTAKL